jgi:UDP-2,3-diacylglucosamine hydrolase
MTGGSNRSGVGTGLVVSDLHLFARRSVGKECLRRLQPRLLRTRCLVLNGDIFDFRWSTISGHTASVERAVDWLETQLATLPDCEIHYVLGNHDCLGEFVARLDGLTDACARFHWHRQALQLGHALFLHGDCANAWMDAASLERYRETWSRDRQRHGLATRAYEVSDRLGFTRLAHRLHFPRRRTIARLEHYLDRTRTGWRETVRQCYFGHTHEPFNDVSCAGVTFHNTGSAITGMGFNPMSFEIGRAA